MQLDSTITGGLIGAFAVLIPSAATFLIAWGNLHATIDGLKLRVTEAERELDKIDQIRVDVSYIRGVFDGEARREREARIV